MNRDPAATYPSGQTAAHSTCGKLWSGTAAAAGLDLAAVTARLEREGVRSFCDSYHQLLGCIERKIAAGAAR